MDRWLREHELAVLLGTWLLLCAAAAGLAATANGPGMLYDEAWLAQQGRQRHGGDLRNSLTKPLELDPRVGLELPKEGAYLLVVARHTVHDLLAALQPTDCDMVCH